MSLELFFKRWIDFKHWTERSLFLKLQVIQYRYTLLYNNLLYNIIYLYWKRENEKILKYYTYWISLKKKKRKNWSYLPLIDNYPKVIFESLILEKNEVRRFVEKYLPWNRVQLLFHGGLSRGGQQQSRIAERDAFSQASAFSSFSRIGVIGARFFFFLFSFSFLFSFCRATRSRTIYKNRYESGTMERWSVEFFLRPAFHPSFAAAVSRAMGKSDRIAR